MSIQLKLNLSDAQLHKLHKGETVQIKNNQIGTGREFKLHPENAKKVVKALKNGTGVRLSVSEAEISGSGVFGKKADKWMEKKGIKKTVYKLGTAVKPLVHEAITATSALASQYGIPTAGAEKFAHTYIDNPEGQQRKVRNTINTTKGQFKQARADYNNGTMGTVDQLLGSGFKRRGLRGKGVNPYMPVRGGSIRGCGMRTQAGCGARTKLRDDQSNFVQSDSGNFYPNKPQTYKELQLGIQPVKQKGGSFINR